MSGAERVPLVVVAEALRQWQRENGGEHQYAPTTMFIDKAELPAQAVLDGLAAAGYSFMRAVTPDPRRSWCNYCHGKTDHTTAQHFAATSSTPKEMTHG